MEFRLLSASPRARPAAERPALIGWGVGFGALLLAAGTAVGALLLTPEFGIRAPLGSPSAGVGLLRRMGVAPLDWLACSLATPLFVVLARRFPLTRRRWPRSLAVHLLVTAGLVLLVGVVFYGWVMPPAGNPEVLRFFAGSHLLTGSPPFWVMIATLHALAFYRRYREREVEAARLHALLAEARLEALTAQLQPHFLFNTLQGISTLIHRDADAADAMLGGLSDLLRHTLQHRHEVTLGDEFDLLERYVALCRARYEGSVTFEIHAAPATRNARVPFFLLQPLVENALRHGLAPNGGNGRIIVCAGRDGDRLRVSVTDDGPGAPAMPVEGIGLTNTRRRLRERYGERYDLRLEQPPEGGCRVVLTLPFTLRDLAEPSEPPVP